MDALKDLVTLSHGFGGADYVQAGGGNTSVKDAHRLWIKPSGTTLREMDKAGFVALDRGKLAAMYTLTLPADVAQREACVADAMQQAVADGSGRRPSVETLLHDAFEARFVVHTHPPFVNGMVCAREGAAAAARLFPDAAWIEHVDPGYTLFKRVGDELRRYRDVHGRQPDTVFLENHGVFVAGDTAGDIEAVYGRVMDSLRCVYEAAGVPTGLSPGPEPSDAACGRVAAELARVFGPEASCIAVSGPFPVARGPLTPDHIVYARSYPYIGAVTEGGLRDFLAAHGYAPRVVATDAGVFGVGDSRRTADLALLLAKDGARVARLTAAFGGVRFMSDAAREFIENWEVEVYRRQVAAESE